jgi:hypothetical protein
VAPRIVKRHAGRQRGGTLGVRLGPRWSAGVGASAYHRSHGTCSARILIRDDADRDFIAKALLRYGDETGDEPADIIDLLTVNPDARRKVVRTLAENDALGGLR